MPFSQIFNEVTTLRGFVTSIKCRADDNDDDIDKSFSLSSKITLSSTDNSKTTCVHGKRENNEIACAVLKFEGFIAMIRKKHS